MGRNHSPHFTSGATIADKRLDAPQYIPFHQIIYILPSRYFASQLKLNRSGTAGASGFINSARTNSQPRSRADQRTAVGFFLAASYTWQIVFGQSTLLRYRFCPNSVPTGRCSGSACCQPGVETKLASFAASPLSPGSARRSAPLVRGIFASCVDRPGVANRGRQITVHNEVIAAHSSAHFQSAPPQFRTAATPV